MKSSTHTFLITEPHCEVTYDCTREKSTLLAPGLTLFPLSPSKAILPFLILYTHRDESLHVLSTCESCFSLVLYLCVIHLATYLPHHLVTQAGLALKIFLHRLPSGKTELCAILPKRRKNPQPEIRPEPQHWEHQSLFNEAQRPSHFLFLMKLTQMCCLFIASTKYYGFAFLWFSSWFEGVSEITYINLNSKIFSKS